MKKFEYFLAFEYDDVKKESNGESKNYLREVENY